VIDSDVLIWYMRGNRNAKAIIDGNMPFKISAVTYMELIQGMRDKRELLLFKEHLKKWSVEILPINERVTARAVCLVEAYALSHSLELADALIAATALEERESLITGNDKHYRCIPNIQLTVFRPR